MTSKSKTFWTRNKDKFQKGIYYKSYNIKIKTSVYIDTTRRLEDKLQMGEMFATYLINKGLAFRLSEKSKKSKRKN